MPRSGGQDKLLGTQLPQERGAATTRDDTAESFTIVKVLLDANARCDVFSGHGHARHPLSLAVATGSAELTALLLEHGADPDNRIGTSAMPEGLPPHQVVLIRRTAPLWDAAFAGHAGVVLELLDAGADPRGLSIHDPAIPAALMCNHVKCRELLVRAESAWSRAWSPHTHNGLPKRARSAVTALFLCNHRGHDVLYTNHEDGIPRLPLEMICAILHFCLGFELGLRDP